MILWSRRTWDPSWKRPGPQENFSNEELVYCDLMWYTQVYIDRYTCIYIHVYSYIHANLYHSSLYPNAINHPQKSLVVWVFAPSITIIPTRAGSAWVSQMKTAKNDWASSVCFDKKKGEPRWSSDKLRIGLGSCSRMWNSWTWNIVIVQFRRPLLPLLLWQSNLGIPRIFPQRIDQLYPLVNVYITGKSPCYQWVNPRTKWPFSIAMLVITRGYHFTSSSSSSRTFLIWTMEVFMSDPRFQVSPVIWKHGLL